MSKNWNFDNLKPQVHLFKDLVLALNLQYSMILSSDF